MAPYLQWLPLVLFALVTLWIFTKGLRITSTPTGKEAYIMHWLKLVEQIAPLVLAATPLAPIAPFVLLGIKTAEQIPGATGQQKLELATQIVNTGVAATNAQAGHQEIDPVQINQAVVSGINAVVAAVNVAHAAQAEDVAEASKSL